MSPIVVGGEALVDLVIDPDGAVTAKLGGGPFNAARTIGSSTRSAPATHSAVRSRHGGTKPDWAAAMSAITMR
jgi:hypothetical protein